ncbi:MAG: chemotaxis protein CheA [Clostridiales bacterium]|nr:chemotaxis protein CheA [Clostridiales bacterium]
MNPRDPMLEVYLYESEQLLETLESTLLQGEKDRSLEDEQINEIFRIMHTFKGSSAMMGFDSLSKLSHAAEDLFSQIRERRPPAGAWGTIFDIVLRAADILRAGIVGLSAGRAPEADDPASHALIEEIHRILGGQAEGGGPSAAQEAEARAEEDLSYDPDTPFYKIRITFAPDSQMEHLRAFGLVNDLAPHCVRLAHIPENLMDKEACEQVASGGFLLYVQSAENPDDLKALLDHVMFLQSASIIALEPDSDELPESLRPKTGAHPAARAQQTAAEAVRTPGADALAKQNFISINVNKLDKLLDLVGEIVTTESMVTKNPEVLRLNLESFDRSSQQLRKLINELQDIVMSIRMVPVSGTFHRMNRIVRDMSKKVGKEVDLVILGEEAEVDKNIIDHLSDPLMHLIRNAVDHGLEPAEERLAKGKPTQGKITLEASNAGGDVVIYVTDDGRGLDRSAIIKKATERGLTTKPEADFTDREAFSLLFLPGFSTRDQVTEFSGRGVGLDVVRRNIEKVGGTVSIERASGEGTSIQIRIPLTLAIIEGMKLRVGDLMFIVPMLLIQESFKPNLKDVFLDPDGNEQIMIRGVCYPIVRLHEIFDIPPEFTDLAEGILILITTENCSYCLFVDQLVEEQQVVVKPLPTYLQRHNDNMHGISGCAIMGDGSISLILDINSLFVVQ